MKIIELDQSESCYLIQDGRKHYRLERIQLVNTDKVQLVLSKLDEEELSGLIRNCTSE